MLTESVMPSNHLIFCHPLLLLSIFSSIRVFSNESVLHIRWPQYWSFSSSISPANEYSALISFRTDWLDLLVVQGTLKSLLQHVVSGYYIEAAQFYKNHISNPKHLDKERLFSKTQDLGKKSCPLSRYEKRVYFPG